MRSLVTREKVILKFAPCTRLRVTNKVYLGKYNQFNPDGRDMIMYCGYGVKIDYGSIVTTDIYVKNGTLIVNPATPNRPNFLTGSYIAPDVLAGAYTYWYWNIECDPSCNAHAGFRISDENNTAIANPSP